jgi:hypothetical protein
MIITNKKLKENLKKITNETIDGLEPIVKDQGNKLMEALKEFSNGVITNIFEIRRNKK